LRAVRYFFSLFLMLAVTFTLGLVVGETYAPISGVTTRELAAKCDELEAKVELLRTRVARMESDANELRMRVGVWLPGL
jgi:outer membrane murein-binding lipoprotein Lpp